MISRRNIRVKVMQTLYSIDSLSGQAKPGEPLTVLTKKIDESRNLFTYLIFFITEVARFAEVDARQKASKHLPSASDLTTNTRIAGNELLWKIVEDPDFKSSLSAAKLTSLVDTDLLKKIYTDLKNSPDYKEYIELTKRDKKSERQILDLIFSNLM